MAGKPTELLIKSIVSMHSSMVDMCNELDEGELGEHSLDTLRHYIANFQCICAVLREGAALGSFAEAGKAGEGEAAERFFRKRVASVLFAAMDLMGGRVSEATLGKYLESFERKRSEYDEAASLVSSLLALSEIFGGDGEAGSQEKGGDEGGDVLMEMLAEAKRRNGEEKDD